MVTRVNSEAEVISKLCSIVETKANAAITARGSFYIGLSGGSLIKYLVAGLPSITTDWSKWHLAFCDERVVPVDSEDSTFGEYKRKLIPATQLNEEQFITIKQGLSAEEAAIDYTEKLTTAFKLEANKLPRFDILLLGMGPDGHTCSLFPGHKLLKETELIVAPITDSPKPPPARVTLTYPVINNAETCIFAVSGAGKSEMIKKILNDKEPLPAGLVSPTNGSLIWIADDAAASQL